MLTQDVVSPLAANRCSRQALVEDLKTRMITGELDPGDRLPTYDRLETHYGASRATLLQVIGDLKRDGFVVSQERRGCYVAPTLPCRTRFGLMFQGHESQNLFWNKLATAATMNSDALQAVVYRNLLHSNTAEWDELEEDLAAQRLGGVIFTHAPENHEALALAQRTDVPKLIICDKDVSYPFSARLHLDNRSFVTRALDDLTARGARRIALITMGPQQPANFLRQEAAARGLELRNSWLQSVPRSDVERAANLVQLMMDAMPERRPDGLIIADDNLTPHIVAGLVEQGLRPDTVLPIVSHANFPDTTRSALPIRRLGFDCRCILTEGLKILQALAKGKQVEDATIAAVFEEEL